MNALVQRLSQGEHPVQVSTRPEKKIEVLKESIDRGFIHIKFTNTQGGTDLGVRLDPALTDLSAADFTNQTGRVRVVGGLTLDYVKVKCIADIELSSLQGTGHLEPVPE